MGERESFIRILGQSKVVHNRHTSGEFLTSGSRKYEHLSVYLFVASFSSRCQTDKPSLPKFLFERPIVSK